MTKQSISSYIRKKMEQLIDSVSDDNVKVVLRENSIVTGGCITSLLMGEKVRDVDVYFSTKQAVKLVAQYYCDQWNKMHPNQQNRIGVPIKAYVLDGADEIQMEKERQETQGGAVLIYNMTPDRIKIIIRSDGVVGEEELLSSEEDLTEVIEEAYKIPFKEIEKKEQQKFRPIFMSPNAVTLSNKVQLVIRFYGSPGEIHTTYDYVHCTNYWTFHGGLVTKKDALESILEKRLYYTGSKYPLCSVIRTRKFLKRGWTINAGQYLKMLFQVSQLDLTKIEVLEDQLVGVDTVYFQELIRTIRADMEKNGPDFRIDSDYVCTVVDKIF